MSDIEAPTIRILERKEYTSSKAYPCALCGGAIAAKERCLRTIYLENGRLKGRRTHRGCPDGAWNGVASAAPLEDEE